MKEERLISWLEDIIEAIEKIESYTKDQSFEDYLRQPMIIDAVERNLEKISEASRHVPDKRKAEHAHIPWHQIAAIGNVLRHAYKHLEDRRIWDTAQHDLSPLRKAAESMLKEFPTADEE